MPIEFERVLDDAIAPLAADRRALPRLNVGSGRDHRDGFVNLDLVAIPGVDVAASLGTAPLPFRTDTFGVVVCRDILEHVDVVPAMRDIHRVTAPGGIVIVSAVHFTSRNLYVDPTHVRGFSVRTLEFFAAEPAGTNGDDAGEGWRRPYYFDFSFRRIQYATIQFATTLGNGRFLVWDRVVEPCVNARRLTQDIYEMTGLSRAFPAANVVAVLQK